MKFRLKLTLTFLFLSILIAIPILSDWFAVSEIQVANDMHRIQEELRIALSLEKDYAQRYIIESEEKSDLLLKRFSSYHAKSHVLFAQLKNNLTTSEEFSTFESVMQKHDAWDQLFKEIRSEVDSDRNLPHLIQSKISEARDTRNQFQDKYLKNEKFAELLIIPIKYHFRGQDLEHRLQWGYTNLQLQENRYLWEYRQEFHEAWLSAINRLTVLINHSLLATQDKQKIFKIFADYKKVSEEVVLLVNSKNLLLLGLKKYKISEAIENKSRLIEQLYLNDKTLKPLLQTPINFTHQDKEYTESPVSAFLNMTHLDRVYLWQYGAQDYEEKRFSDWLQSAEVFERSINFSKLPESLKLAIVRSLNNYIALVSRAEILLKDIKATKLEADQKKTLQIEKIFNTFREIRSGKESRGMDYMEFLTLRSINESIRDLTNNSRIIGLIAIYFSIVIGIVLYRSISKPLRDLREATDAIARGELDTVITKTSKDKDEFGSLARAFNKMANTIQTSDKSLRKTRSYLENILTSMPSSLIVVDNGFNITRVNQVTLQILEYAENELVGEALDTILNKDSVHLEHLMRRGSIQDFKSCYVTKSGKAIPIRFSGSVIQDSSGNQEGAVCIGLPVTEQLA